MADDSKELMAERSTVASVRIDLVKIALWVEWLEGQRALPRSINQAVSTMVEYVVDSLVENKMIRGGTVRLNDAVRYLEERGLMQRRMYGAAGHKLQTFRTFELLREDECDPEHYPGFAGEYRKFHGTDGQMTLPLQRVTEERHGGQPLTVKGVDENKPYRLRTYAERKIEKLSEEDIGKLKELWIAMTDAEKAVFQSTPYPNEMDRIEAFMRFYPRFRGDYPSEYVDADAEVYRSEEYLKWADEYLAKKDAFIWAMSGLIPESVAVRERLEVDEEGVVTNVVRGGYDVSQELIDEVRRKEEKQKELARLAKEQKKIMKEMVREELRKRDAESELLERDEGMNEELSKILEMLNPMVKN